MTNANWKDSANAALTNLVDLGTNTLGGLAQSARDKIQGTSTNIAPTQVYPAPSSSNDNLFLLLVAGAVLYLVFKKK